MMPSAAGPARPPRGFTLIELLMVLGILAVLTALTLPSFAEQRDRQRLQAAAESLAADLDEARFDAARRGQPLHVHFVQGADWCYGVAAGPGCDCSQSPGCTVKAVQGSDLPGIRLAHSTDAVLQPSGTATAAAVASFATIRGDRLQVVLTPLGRPYVCAPDSGTRRYPRC
jgi:prepilin-type N-terminal cleavage/methylation domain-containing protein